MRSAIRLAIGLLPRESRFKLYRSLVACDPRPDPGFELKIAETKEELEACFRILHDAYVAEGYMKPDPSGLRVTIYHALPTTTTLCAKFEGRVIGTISIIREGVFGFPLQAIFDISQLRASRGQIAEVSALAIDPKFRRTGGKVLFPLMKFMYEYCREYFDTRHLVIAVNPTRIELYESLLFFERLEARVVDNYDFANGAPAVGASVDLRTAPERFRAEYGLKPERKNLYSYFIECRMPNIRLPQRRYFTTNDPVMTPPLMDYFFNQRTQTFAKLDDRKRLLLHSIYADSGYAEVLPPPSAEAMSRIALRRHRRFSLRCPAEFRVPSYGTWLVVPMQVVDVSRGGFQAECSIPLPEGTCGQAVVELGHHDTARLQAVPVRRQVTTHGVSYGFQITVGDDVWASCVTALEGGRTHGDLAPVPPAGAASPVKPRPAVEPAVAPVALASSP